MLEILPPFWASTRHWLSRCTTTLILLTSASAPSVGEAEKSFSKRGATILGAGYRFITEHYVQPVSARQVAIAGLEGLHALDSSLSATLKGNQVIVRKSDRVVARFPTPDHGDPHRWASTTVKVILSVQSASPKVRGAGAEAIYKAVFSAAMSSLDKYSRYLSAAEARDSRAWREGYGGIGITIRSEKGSTLVVSVMPNTPAERAGIKVADLLVKIDGRTIEGWSTRRVEKRLQGPRGSFVRLTLSRASRNHPFDVRMKRRFFIPKSVRYRLEGPIAYITISRFIEGTGLDVARAVHAARRKLGRRLAGFVLDLRNNPGGLLDQAITVVDLFLVKGLIVSARGRHPDSFRRYVARKFEMTDGLPVVVLVNERSASAAELVAAALQDNRRAVVVGSHSFGHGTVQRATALPNGGVLIVSWSRLWAPSGIVLDGLGVLPNLCTSTSSSAAGAITTVLRKYRSTTLVESLRWRQAGQKTGKRRSTLRALCPDRTKAKNFDFDQNVARRVILDGRLYGSITR